MASWAYLTKILAGGDEIWRKITSLALCVLPCPPLSLWVPAANTSLIRVCLGQEEDLHLLLSF